MKTVKNINNEVKKTRFTYKRKIWCTIASVAAVIVIIVGAKVIIESPRDLGKNIVFLNKVNTSCEWWEVPLYIGFCHGPSYEYYFATDMNSDELKKYFQKASLVDTRPRYSTSLPARLENTRFIFEYQGQDFVIDMSASKQQTIKEFHLKDTNLRYVISIPDFDYNIARKAL